MPKQRITKEMVVETAFQLAKEGGMSKVLVKDIANTIGCSVQPIYCYCDNMDGLKQEVVNYTKVYMGNYIKARLDKNDVIKSTGLAYALFAKEEPHLYRVYFFRDRKEVSSMDDLFKQEGISGMVDYLVSECNMNQQKAAEFYNYLMIFNTGISVMLSTLGERTDMKEVVKYQTAAYEAFYYHINKN